MPVYERNQSAERASQANMDKFYDTNAPGIRINDKMLSLLPKLQLPEIDKIKFEEQIKRWE